MLTAALVDSGHTGVPVPRTVPELSDLALFVMAALGVWLVRRALRARAAKQRAAAPNPDRD